MTGQSVLLYIILICGVTLPAGVALAGEKQMPDEEDMTRVLFDFSDKSQAEQWRAVNDNVMGGLSQGEAALAIDSCLLFSGSLSLENNGGFASIRTQPQDFKLTGYRGLRIRVKGDGRTYQFRLRLDKNFDGIAFKQDFETVEGSWLEVELPFAVFQPTYRGKILPDVAPIEAADIRQLGFLIADKKTGPFSLMVDRIEAVK